MEAYRGRADRVNCGTQATIRPPKLREKRALRGAAGRKNGYAARKLFRVMKNDAERVPMAGANSAHAVTQVDAVVALRSLHRPIMDGEQNRIALPQGNYLDPALHPRPLFGQNELAAGKIPVWFRQQDGGLQREGEIAVQILMQTIIVAGAILQQQRGRAHLSRFVTDFQVIDMVAGIPWIQLILSFHALAKMAARAYNAVRRSPTRPGSGYLK